MKNRYMFLSIVIMTMVLSISGVRAQENFRMPLLGDKAPSFKANSTKGEINFPDDYWNKWVVLFSHPADFTPVCTSELMTFAALSDEFEALDCELIGLSVDGVQSHIQWIKEIESIEYNGMKNVSIDYPIIADVHYEIAGKFGMIHPNAISRQTVRGVYIIDDKHKIQAILMYPKHAGRDIKEILRLVKALQYAEKEDVVMPEGWQPGDGVFLNPPESQEEAMNIFNNPTDKYTCPAWFMCIKSTN